MSPAEKKQFQIHMELHYYATGTSFCRIEDVRLASAIKILRPDDVLPNRKTLSTTLLDQWYDEVKSKVDALMKNSTAYLITDGWTNVKNDPVVTYMATSPDCCLFLESVKTGKKGNNADWISGHLSRVLMAYHSTAFAGALTDNTATNKKAWQMLQNRFTAC
jgi:hypothetical protein